MDENYIQEMCNEIFKPISEKLLHLIDSLDSKISTMLSSIESHFGIELEKRDQVIDDLANKLDNIVTEREDENNEINLIRDRLSTLEAKAATVSHLNGDTARPSSSWKNQFGNDMFNTNVINDWGLDDVESQDKGTIDLLVAGDSCTKYLDLEKINPGKENKLICILGGKTGDLKKAVMDTYSENKVSHCVVHIGTNHTSTDEPYAVAEKILALLKDLRKNMRQTALHYSAILPKFSNSWLPGFNEINHRVFQQSKAVRVLIYFP